MSKQEFLAELRKRLYRLPQNELEERLTFYSEMIDDRMEEGLTEKEAVFAIGNVSEIVSQIFAENPPLKLAEERVRPKRSFNEWTIMLLILGFPLWFPLLVAALSIIFAAYVVMWSLIVSLWVVEFSFAVIMLAVIMIAAVIAFRGNIIAGVAVLGAGIFLAGLSVFLFFGCRAATKGVFFITKKAGVGIKSLFDGKE